MFFYWPYAEICYNAQKKKNQVLKVKKIFI